MILNIQQLKEKYLNNKITVSEALAKLSRLGVGKQQSKDVLYDWNSQAAGKEFMGWFCYSVFGYSPL